MSGRSCNPSAMPKRRRRIRRGGVLLAAALALLQTSPTEAAIEVGGVTSTDACYAALQSALPPGQTTLDQEGYVQFVNTLSDGAFTAFQYSDEEDQWDFFPVSEFDQLPAAIRGEFYKHACGGPYVICENAFLYAEGTEGGDDVVVDAQQEIYLYGVCVGVEGAIDESKPPPPTPGTQPTDPPTTPPPIASPVDLFSGEKQLQLVYHAAVPASVSTEELQSSDSDMRKDLLGAMTSWSFMTGNDYYKQSGEAPGKKRGKPANLGLGGGRGLRRGLQDARTVRPKPLVADPNEQESMQVVDVACPKEMDTQLEASDHCIEVTTTLTLVFEDEPAGSEEVALKYFEDSFDADLRDGTFYNLIPPKSQSNVRAVYPVPDAESLTGGAPAPNASPDKAIEDPNTDNVEGEEGDSGDSSNTGGIVAGVIVSLVVVGVGMYAWHRRKSDGEGGFFKKFGKDADLADDLEGAPVRRGHSKGGHSQGVSSRDEFSHRSSQSSVASYSDSGSRSSGDSSSSYTSTSSYSHDHSRSTHGDSADNRLRMSTQSDMSHPYEAYEASDSGSYNTSGSSGRLQGAKSGNRSRTTDEDSSAGSSGWDSSDGDSSVDTGSAESYDPNTIVSGSSATVPTDGTADEANTAAMVNPAVNPVVQRGVTMIPIQDAEPEDSTAATPASDESSTRSDLLGRRRDEAPLGGEIQDAIEKGDWAAVGATAAILASDSSAASTQQDDTASRDASTIVSGSLQSGDMSDMESSAMDSEQAAEIDQLVEDGNWDGVVAVAARYADEADEADQSLSQPLRSSHGSPKGSLLADSAASGETAGSGGSVSVASAASSSIHDSVGSHSIRSSLASSGMASSASLSASQSGTDPSGGDSKTSPSLEEGTIGSSITSSYLSQGGGVTSSMLSADVSTIGQEKREMSAYRAEVEALVRRVVPDEIDNVDDIMVQFSGREEELIETLRAMQEKSIAQRARAAVQKSAKKEVGRSGRSANTDESSEDYGRSVNTDDVQSDTSDGHSYTTDGQSYTTGQSITVGDDYSTSSSGSGSISSSSQSTGASGTESSSPDSKGKMAAGLTDAIESSNWKAVGETAKKMGSTSEADKSRNEKGELDDLIDEGNWSGIMDAASKMTPEELD